jgi:hypothetical protein
MAAIPESTTFSTEFDFVYFNYKKMYLSQSIATAYNYLCPFSWKDPKDEDMFEGATGYSICHEGWYYYTNTRISVYPFINDVIISIGPSFAIYNYKMYTSSGLWDSNRLNANGHEKDLMKFWGFNTSVIFAPDGRGFFLIGLELFFSSKHKFKYKIEHNEGYNLNPVYNDNLWLMNLIVGFGIYLF